jgi:hypothetical protein
MYPMMKARHSVAGFFVIEATEVTWRFSAQGETFRLD